MATTAETYHKPVLLKDSVDGLDIQPDGIYVDVTYGGGGHSREILSRLGAKGRLYAFDQDADAQQNIIGDSRLRFIHSNFRYLKQWMRFEGEQHIDGLLADLGVSSHHFDDAARGFSFRFDAPLDMRMNRSAALTAADVVNNSSEQQLSDIFYIYGEMRNSRQVASALVKARAQKPIRTTGELVEATRHIFARERQRAGVQEKKEVTKMFQALRIEVNHEMDALRQLLTSACQLLAPGGRMSIITYHSLEDRMVKNMMKAGNVEGRASSDFFGRSTSPLTPVGKVIVPTPEEQQQNPRSRSAKLRVAVKS